MVRPGVSSTPPALAFAYVAMAANPKTAATITLDQCSARPVAAERPSTQAWTKSRNATMAIKAAADIQMPARIPSSRLCVTSAFASLNSFCIRSPRSDTTLDRASGKDWFIGSGMALLEAAVMRIGRLDWRRRNRLGILECQERKETGQACHAENERRLTSRIIRCSFGKLIDGLIFHP